MDGPELFKAWGLPAHFWNFRRWFGANSVEVNREPVNSGDFLEREGLRPRWWKMTCAAMQPWLLHMHFRREDMTRGRFASTQSVAC